MDPLSVTSGSPDRLLALVLHAATPTNDPAYREQVVEMLSSFSAITSMSLDVRVDDAADEERWTSLRERLEAFLLLVEGATGEIVHRNVKTIVPELVPEFEAQERAALARARAVAERIEDAVDYAAAERARAELSAGNDVLVPLDEVARQLGLP